MGEKKSKWLEHLMAAEISGLKLSAYAANQQIDVRRLYEAKRTLPVTSERAEQGARLIDRLPPRYALCASQ